MKFDSRILYSREQFYSNSQNRPITIHVIKQAIWDAQKGRNRYVELFSSASDINVLKFMRDYWFELNGKELPKDDEVWNKVKKQYYERKGY